MKFNFVGYGSLVSHKSLRETVTDKKFRLVCIKGFKRIFDIEEKRGDVLNILPSRKDKFNGVMFKLDKDEMRKMKRRENGYKMVETNVFDFKTRKSLGRALVAEDLNYEIDHSKRLPSKAYFILCREAAYHISRNFGSMWDKTTFISNGQIVSSWIKRHPEFDTINLKRSVLRF